MAHIKTIHEREATGELAEWYRRVGNPDGTVDNVMKVHSLNPDTLRTHFEMYTAAMHKHSPLSRAEREMVAVTVSRLNGCTYCLRHHHADRRVHRLLCLRLDRDYRRHRRRVLKSGGELQSDQHLRADSHHQREHGDPRDHAVRAADDQHGRTDPRRPLHRTDGDRGPRPLRSA